MRAHTAINAGLFAAICAVFVLGACLDGPSDHQAQADQLTNLQNAIKAEAASARFTKAAATICGNAGWTLQSDGAVRCVPRKGKSKGEIITVAQVTTP